MFSYGTVIAFIATLDPILKSLHFEDSNQITGVTILSSMIVGILATPIFSRLIKKTKKYKLITCLSKYLFKNRYSWVLCIYGIGILHILY